MSSQSTEAMYRSDAQRFIAMEYIECGGSNYDITIIYSQMNEKEKTIEFLEKVSG